MSPRHQVSRAAIELIKRFEGYRRRAAQLPDGRWTIGYGHTRSAREGAEVSAADAEALLLYDLMAVAEAVRGLVYAELTHNQFDALCAFAFSIGVEAFRASDVLKRVNEGAFTQAAFALELWRRAEFEGERIVVDALVRRRAAEKLLFLTPADDAWRPVPSAVIRAELDRDAPDTAPRETPAEVIASLEGDQVAVARAPAAAAAAPASPVKAAAEAFSARMQALFAEAAEAAAIAEAVAEPEVEPAALTAAEPEPAIPEPEAAAEPSVEDPPFPIAEPANQPGPAPEAEPVRETSVVVEVVEDEDGPRILIDDTAPYEFVPATVKPLDPETGDGLLAIVALLVVGLAFFAGGVFWALNAPPPPDPGVFTPLLVGWLAGVAGVGFVAAAVFMLLQRMTRAAERRERRRY